jgi:hypothetical protein
VWGYPSTYLISGGLSALALPFIARSRAQREHADIAEGITEGPERGTTSPEIAAGGVGPPGEVDPTSR